MDKNLAMKEKSYNVFIAIFSVTVVILIAILYFLPDYEGMVNFDVTIFPLLNAIFNVFTFSFLLCSLYAIKNKNIKVHRNFILAAFVSTFFFLISYVTYHFLSEPTPFGGNSILKYVYYFILISHILLAILNVPLALLSVVRGYMGQVEKHRKIGKITMPIWLYVSFTGILVYVLISPYYG
ncbi:DUF420 domain-containing protein [Longirhabdus pacifica]|uniref:DUF420 domain-containing protein n=1 Tax=Longirhabdus pacifica TaxID=2305227 RepID=UPI001F0C777D|nr:DUF420 domain-containing protein [Longirhabdus pacifica]